MKAVLTFLSLLVLVMPASAKSGALMRGLDRLNGAVEDFEIGAGEVMIYERLKIELADCRLREGSAEAHAYLRIWDVRRPDEVLFDGWMFAASPAFAALDHPRYDVWVLSCKT